MSQENWGEMRISKHHFAIALANANNDVFYIYTGEQNGNLKRGNIIVSESDHSNLTIVKFRYLIPLLFIKYKLKIGFLYKIGVFLFIRKLIYTLGKSPDLVWSFDLSNVLPLSSFPTKLRKILMPVDERDTIDPFDLASGADLIISVTDEILRKFHQLNCKKVFLNHSVSDIFFKHSYIKDHYSKNIKIGYSGSLLRFDIDHVIFLKIVRDNPSVEFHLFGEYDYSHSSIHTKNNYNEQCVDFIDLIKAENNVLLHGVLNTDELSCMFRQMDGFMICYDIAKEQSKGTNYHKILEYLASGKVVISNNVSTYERRFPGMIEMVKERDSNRNLPELFNHTIQNLTFFNSQEKQDERIAFSANYTMKNQIKKIQDALNDLN